MVRSGFLVSVAVAIFSGPCSGGSSGEPTKVDDKSTAFDASVGGDASIGDASASASDAAATAAVTTPAPSPGWSTPPADGADFFVALDGDCEGITLHPVHGGTFLEIGPTHGAARITADGLDLSYRDGIAAAEEKQGYGAGAWESMTGTPDDLWVHTMPGGSVFRPSGLLHRADGKWSAVAPLGTDNMAYVSIAPFQGGAIGNAIIAEHGEAGPRKLFGVGGVNAAALFPADATIAELRTLENGLVVAIDDGAVFHDSDAGFVAEYQARAPRVFLLGPKDTRAHAAKLPTKKGVDLTLFGHTTTSLRALVARSAFVFDGEDFIAEPAGAAGAGGPSARIGNIDASHANGSTDVRLEQGALLLRDGNTYRPARLPVLPFSEPVSSPSKLKVSHVTVGSDGEVFVVMSRVQKSHYGYDLSWSALLRQKRPREALRCSERSMDGTVATTTGIESWPARISDACTTPFVVLATYPVGQQPAKGQPETVKVLSKHKDLLPVTLVRVETAGRSVVGTAARDQTHARALAEVLKKERGLFPEIVCASPPSPEKLVEVQ